MNWMKKIKGWAGKAVRGVKPAGGTAKVASAPTPANDAIQPECIAAVVAGTFFPALCLKREPKYRFVAVPSGTLCGQNGTVFFDYSQRIRCGTVLKAHGRRRFVVVERSQLESATAA